MLFIASFHGPARGENLYETFVGSWVSDPGETRMTVDPWLDVATGQTYLIAAAPQDRTQTFQQVTDEIASGIGQRASVSRLETVALALSLPSPRRRIGFCELQFNPRAAPEQHLVSCTQGHHFERRHDIENCTHCGEPVS